MKINQYACVSLTHDYQKKGDNPESKDQWIILNKAQCIQHQLLEYEPPIGPGKFDQQNTEKIFTTPSIQSSQLFTIINDKLLVAFKNIVLQYECIAELFSADKCATCSPQFKYTIQQGDVISLLTNQNQLIVQTKQAILLYKSNNQNFTQQKIYNYSDVKQLNIDNNQLFLCLKDKLVLINLINLTETILKTDNQIVSGFYQGDEYYYICQNSSVIKNSKQEYKVNIQQDIQIKQLFVIGNYICICGYETKYEPMDDDDDEPATYSAHIKWFDKTQHQPLEAAQSLEVDLIADTLNNGDFGVKQISDLWVVYGSNLRRTTFWKVEQFCTRAKKFENTDEILELLQHVELRGLTFQSFSEYLGFGMNQKSFRCIKRNPNICVFDKKGGLTLYEFFNFRNIVDYKIESENQSVIRKSLFQSLIQGPQKKQWKDIKYTVVESDPREITKLSNPPFNLTLQTKNKDSQLVCGFGKIYYNFKLYQNLIPSANLIAEYQHYQIIGNEREIIILDPKCIQNILLQQNHQIIIHKITQNPNEVILGVYEFQNQILVQTNATLYQVSLQDESWVNFPLLQLNQIRRISILKEFILVQFYFEQNQILVYQYQDDGLVLVTKQIGDAGCLFEMNDVISLLYIQDEQLYFLKDFTLRQIVQTDIKIDYSKEYFVAQLHENHIYISFATLEDYNFQQYILYYNIEQNEAKQEEHLQDVLQQVTVNDFLTNMTSSDWNITYINNELSKLICVVPNGTQFGFILQVCGNDLRTLDDEGNNFISIPCYSNIIRGISTLHTMLPNENNLSSTPGFLSAKSGSQQIQYPLQPSILLYEYDNESVLTIHRYLIIQLDGFQYLNSKPFLKQYVEKKIQTPKVIVQQPASVISQTESQKSLQPPPSPQNVPMAAQPTKITFVTQRVADFCQLAIKQINGEKDETLTYKPYFSFFTSQNTFDELQAKYFHIHNVRCKMLQQTQESSAVQDFCLLRKSFEVPKFAFTYSDIERALTKLVQAKEQYSWLCNFVIETLSMNPFQRDRISFGEFQLPSIKHIHVQNKQFSSPAKGKTGRKIIFTEFSTPKEQQPSKVDSSSIFIQRLCASTKSRVKYFQLSKENRNEGNDLNLQNLAVSVTSFGAQSQRLLKPPQLNVMDEISEDEQQNQTESLNLQFKTVSDKSSLQNNKGLSRTKGGLFNDQASGPQPASRNPLDSDSRSVQKKMVESVLFDKKEVSQKSSNPEVKPQEESSKFGFLDKSTQNKPEEKKSQGIFIGLASQPAAQGSSLFQFSSAANQQAPLFGTADNKAKNSEDKPDPKNEEKKFKGFGVITAPPKQEPIIQAQKKQEPPGGLFKTDSQPDGLFSKPISDSQSLSMFAGLNISQQPQETPKEPPKQLPPKAEPPKEAPKKQDPPKEPPKEAPKQEPPKEAPKQEPPKEAPKQEPPKEAPKQAPPKETQAQQPPSASLFSGFSTSLLFTSAVPQQSTTDFLGIKVDQNQTPKKETKKPESTPFSIFGDNAPKPDNTPKPENPSGLLFTLNTGTSQPAQPATVSQPATLAQPAPNSLFSGFNTAGTSLTFTNFPQNQSSSSLFQQQPTTQPFAGMQSIGIAQPTQNTGFNINTASFGTGSSIFDQPQQQQAPQQRISFSGLQSQGQALPNSIGGLMGSTPQGGFLQTNSSFNLGFDPTSERPRK